MISTDVKAHVKQQEKTGSCILHFIRSPFKTWNTIYHQPCIFHLILLEISSNLVLSIKNWRKICEVWQKLFVNNPLMLISLQNNCWFFMKSVYPTMFGENFQIYAVQITGKCIVSQKTKSRHLHLYPLSTRFLS